ncbi:hypothetical protein EV426DRAFT_571439 [Tirmania nivea]|nr:hypothetical protein EV426DRAFT_571439 [Tirmania nivea]
METTAWNMKSSQKPKAKQPSMPGKIFLLMQSHVLSLEIHSNFSCWSNFSAPEARTHETETRPSSARPPVFSTGRPGFRRPGPLRPLKSSAASEIDKISRTSSKYYIYSLILYYHLRLFPRIVPIRAINSEVTSKKKARNPNGVDRICSSTPSLECQPKRKAKMPTDTQIARTNATTKFRKAPSHWSTLEEVRSEDDDSIGSESTRAESGWEEGSICLSATTLVRSLYSRWWHG